MNDPLGLPYFGFETFSAEDSEDLEDWEEEADDDDFETNSKLLPASCNGCDRSINDSKPFVSVEDKAFPSALFWKLSFDSREFVDLRGFSSIS